MASKRKKKPPGRKPGRNDRRRAPQPARRQIDLGAPAIIGPNGGPSPDVGGDREILFTERASATPMSKRVAEVAAPLAVDHVEGVEGPFDDLLDWFSTVVTDPRSAADGVKAADHIRQRLGATTIEAIVRPNDRMTAVDRMGLYQYAYHARLIGCLEDDYPAIIKAIGPSRFDLLARKYIEAHPSDNPNLNHFGRHFADFCDTQSGWLEHHAFVRDLAKLEWAMVEIIHAPETDPVSMAALEKTPQERWPDIRLPPSPTVRFLEFEYPANAFFQATREGQSPAIPEKGWSATAVYRVGYRVWRMGFTKPMAAVLKTLIAGGTLGESLARLSEPNFAPNIGETDVMVWFKEWVMGGFFERVDLGE